MVVRGKFIIPQEPYAAFPLNGIDPSSPDPVRPTLCDLTPSELCHVLLRDLLRLKEKVFWKAKFIKQGKNKTTTRLSEVKDAQRELQEFFGAPRFVAHIEQLSNCFADEGYKAQILLARQKTSLGYRFLIDAIGALAYPSDLQKQNNKKQSLPEKDIHFKQERDRAIEACRRFVEVFQPSCWVAYFLDYRSNCAHLLVHDGLLFPEAISRYARKGDLSMRILFQNDETVNVYPPFPHLFSSDNELHKPNGYKTPNRSETSGTFRLREQIDDNRVLAFRTTWGASRMVLFLNWRKNTPSDKLCRNMRHFWDVWRNQPLEGTSQVKDKGVLNDQHTDLNPMATFALAARYFNAWLTAANIDLTESSPSIQYEPAKWIVNALKAARNNDNETAQNKALVKAVEDTLHLEYAPICDVYRHGDNKLNCTNIPIRGGKPCDLIFSSLPINNFSQTSFGAPFTDAFLQAAVNLRLIESGLVKESICAQAAAWKVSLMIDYENPDHDEWRWELWSKMHVPSGQELPAYELAVPIMSDDVVKGVANVKCPSGAKLNSSHLHRVELVLHLFDRIEHLFKLSSEGSKFRSWVSELDERQKHISAFQHFARQCSSLILKHLDASVVYFAMFDARFSVFRAMGTTLSSKTVEKMLLEPKELIHFGITKTTDDVSNTLLQAYKSIAPKDRETSPLHRLIEHAIISRLRPRRNTGRSREVYMHRKANFIRDTRPIEEDLDYATKHYAGAIMGLPLRHDISANVDGVVWIGWENSTMLPKKFHDPQTDNEFETFAQEDLGPFLEVVAAAFAIYRYHDPDKALAPLPFERY